MNPGACLPVLLTHYRMNRQPSNENSHKGHQQERQDEESSLGASLGGRSRNPERIDKHVCNKVEYPHAFMMRRRAVCNLGL